jgi:hypothetical protein
VPCFNPKAEDPDPPTPLTLSSLSSLHSSRQARRPHPKAKKANPQTPRCGARVSSPPCGSCSGTSDGGAGAEDDRSGGGMGLHAEGHHQAQEHPRGQARAAVQLRGLHDALHVRLPSLFALVSPRSGSIRF